MRNPSASRRSRNGSRDDYTQAYGTSPIHENPKSQIQPPVNHNIVDPRAQKSAYNPQTISQYSPVRSPPKHNTYNPNMNMMSTPVYQTDPIQQTQPQETPEEAYRRELGEINNAEEMIQRYFQEIAKKQQHIDHEFEIDDRFEDLQEELNDKQLSYKDFDFPAGSSSMVNNSRKTNKPYVNLKWVPLHEIYQVRFTL